MGRKLYATFSHRKAWETNLPAQAAISILKQKHQSSSPDVASIQSIW
jgi:hypothetical protein